MRGSSDEIHVLHVDDEPDFAEMAAEFIQRQNERFEVETASSASEALTRLNENQVDCIVSDFDMPGQTGIELLEAVREEHPDLPFILFTGKGSEEIASEAISAGVTDYLQKGSDTSQYAILAQRIKNAVEATRAEHNLEETLSRVTDAIYTLDTDWRITSVNEGTEEIMGPEEELLGENLWEQFPEAAEGIVWEKYHEAMETQEPKTFEVFYEPLDDLWATVTAYPSPTGLTIYFRDIGEQKEREQQLQRERDRFLTLFEHLPNPVVHSEVQGSDPVIIRVNRAFEETFGYDRDEVFGKTIDELIVPEGRREEGLSLNDRLLEEGHLTTEIRRTTPDGQRDFILSAVLHEQDERVEGYTIYTDITDRKEREKEVMETRERFETLFNSIHEAVVVANTDRQIIECNDAFSELFGYTRDEIEGRSTSLLYEDPTDFEGLGQAIQEQIDDQSFTMTVTYETKGGRTFEGETNVSDFRDSEGELLGFLGVIRDASTHQ